jgi:hypothetical protein
VSDQKQKENSLPFILLVYWCMCPVIFHWACIDWYSGSRFVVYPFPEAK